MDAAIPQIRKYHGHYYNSCRVDIENGRVIVRGSTQPDGDPNMVYDAGEPSEYIVVDGAVQRVIKP
jgi:hypothetical protein